MVIHPLYNALYGLNYSIHKVTYIVAVCIYSEVRVVKLESTQCSHDIAQFCSCFHDLFTHKYLYFGTITNTI